MEIWRNLLPKAVRLNAIKPNAGSNTPLMRLGRGPGSGKGRSSGRGTKGQYARNTVRRGFEGGQSTIFRRAPKVGGGFMKKEEFATVNISKVQQWVDRGLLDPKAPITQKHLVDTRCVGRALSGIKLLANGKEDLQTGLVIEVARTSAAAKAAIEEKGGKVVEIYRNKLGLRALLKPESFEKKGKPLPTPARVPPHLSKYYSNQPSM